MSDATRSSTVHDRSREQLYDIVARDGESLDAKRREIVTLGADYLGVELGFVSAVDTAAERFEVLVSTDEEMLTEGAAYDLSRTYCRRCVDDGSSLAVSDTLAAGWETDPAYEAHGFGCYLGTPIRVDGDVVGTVCFADGDGRKVDFTPTERAFVELAARLLGREQEVRRYEEALSGRKTRLDRREAQLERSEEKYESLVAAAPDAIAIADAESGTILEANDATADLTGLSRSELVGRNIREFSPLDPTDRHWAEFERFVLTGEGTRSCFSDGTQIHLRQADGSLVPVEISAATMDVDGDDIVQLIVRDVSDRRERERELRIKDRAIEEAPLGITIADASADRNPLVYANERFEEMTGYDQADVTGRNCRLLQGPDTDSGSVERLRAAIDAEEPVRTELLNYRADGTPFWNDVSIAPVRDGHGDTSHFVGFQREVTERKRQEQLVDVLNRALRHNLRNGMNVVRAGARQLAHHVDDPDAVDLVDTIQERAADLISLGERARTIDRAVSAETTATHRDVAAIVDHVAQQLRRERDDARVTVTTPAEQRAYVTETLRAAVRELATNAVTHSGPDPTVAIDVTATDADTVEITVADDGPGLPQQERTVLDRGHETPLEHGSGLGLWFVNWVVTGVGGTVDVAVDDGTAVTLTLQNPSGGDERPDGHRTSLRG